LRLREQNDVAARQETARECVRAQEREIHAGLQRQNSELQREVDDEKQNWTRLQTHLQQQISELKCQLGTEKECGEAIHTRLQLQNNELQELKQQNSEWQSQLDLEKERVTLANSQMLWQLDTERQEQTERDKKLQQHANKLQCQLDLKMISHEQLHDQYQKIQHEKTRLREWLSKHMQGAKIMVGVMPLRTRTQTHTHAHKRTHTHTHMLAHTHKHTHKDAHTLSLSLAT